jgi:WD40 repeat protein
LDSKLKIFNVDNGELIHTIESLPVNTWKIAFQPHREGVVAATGSGGGVTLYTLPSREVDPGKPSSSAPAKDGKESKATQISAPKPPVVLKTPSGVFTSCLSFSRDGYLLALGDKDGVVSIFDLNPNTHSEPKLLKSFEAHLCPLRTLAFTNDGSTLITGADDASIGIFDVKEGRKIAILTGHAGPIYCVAVSNGSKFIASASHDKKVKVWTLADRECIITLHHHQAPVNVVDWDDKGERLFSAGDDKIVIVYKNIAH